MQLGIPDDEYAAIAEQIRSDASPVGIDAEKTHVLILHLLLDLRRRLAALEERVSGLEDRSD